MHSKISKLILALTMVLTCHLLQAQGLSISSDTLVWQIDQLMDEPSAFTMDYTCRFITYGKSKISWIQKSDYTNEFQIIAVKGSWPNPLSDGKIEYVVRYMNKTGVITIGRSADSSKIKMIFLEGNKNAMPQVFNIQSVAKKI